MTDADLEALVEDLVRAHGAHTLLLYGSHARGDATPASDVDVAAFTDATAEITRDARRWRGRFLDGFVYPTAAATAVRPPLPPELHKLDGAKVLRDERGLAGPLLAAIAEELARGPAPLPAAEAQMRRTWAHKMLARIARGDVEAHYRHHWLLYQLLEDHFALAARWYRGPKEALAELARDAPALHAAFAAALAPGAGLAPLATLVEAVVGAAPADDPDGAAS